MTSPTPSPAAETTRHLRAAMFVDFDNVYIGLRRLDPAAAEAFATDPGHWLAELETGTDADGDFTRRFLIRSCYLNPSVFSQFRPNFTRAGFQVVDCPSLTQQGKSSADINLVLDAVDALAAQTRYEEIVIVSADADFTPLALRCRADDRRVTIITASPAASAYRAVADTVITADDLAELVTGTTSDDVPEVSPASGGTSGSSSDTPSSSRSRGGRGRRSGGTSSDSKTAAARKTAGTTDTTEAAETTEAPGAAEAAEVAAEAATSGTAKTGKGAASGTKSGATRGRRSATREQRAAEVTLPAAAEPDAPTETGEASETGEAQPERRSAGPATPPAEPLSRAARRAVLKRVLSADRPLTLGSVAQAAQKADPSVADDGWGGTGGFAAWVAQEVPELGVSQRPPGHVWDKNRFGAADVPGAVADTDPSALQRQVVNVTDVPGLSPENYAALLTTLADDVRQHPFERASTSRRVRATCQDADVPVGRSTVNFVISGILYSGADLGPDSTAAGLADAFAENVVGLCRGARMELTPGDVSALRAWVGGGLLDE
ncbi:NYN domain-containing protein [Paraoerskovia sediminicola]|uniref:NYN domain-containing protein n=1 Tax=Paraoerskovia sediminicola TaxID=1138587 RepID=UPI0025725305|nr:NYN domain-containing protein [Paraoerskovia sediminicola]